ncbi:MAG TPA: MBL fold metallo-hydrolase, partial [Candidatus Paceibacterota bacterium]|nr:MBL fold metallo-hydrolase [Candidatus Paceibacterota bacterium]
MKITKIGHCCLVVEAKGACIMTDPGAFTKEAIADIRDIDAVIFTHEHQDHYHLESLKVILQNNPNAVVIGNSAMQKLLEAEGIACTLVGEGGKTEVRGVLVEGFGTEHALVYPPDTGKCENTGYMI